jgi:hypothetical protein
LPKERWGADRGSDFTLSPECATALPRRPLSFRCFDIFDVDTSAL